MTLPIHSLTGDLRVVAIKFESGEEEEIMLWWAKMSQEIKAGDNLLTPGAGISGGGRQRIFTINSIKSSVIEISSGKVCIKLARLCFDVIEEAFNDNSRLWLRCASTHTIEALDGSADKLIREKTKSQLARGNYVCSILEKSGVVKYSMRGNKKGIELQDSKRQE